MAEQRARNANVDVLVDPRDSFAELSKILLDAQPLEAVLDRVAQLVKQSIPGAGEVSVTLMDDGRAHSAAFTGEPAMALDERQYDEGFGPCLDAAVSGNTIQIEDTSSSDSYPEFSRHAHALAVRRTLSVGMPIPQGIIGGLNIYGLDEKPFDEEAVRLAETFAGYAAIALANAALYHNTAELAAQMRDAMRSRAVIEQAKGVLMAARHCSADQAFALLTQASQRTNRKLRDIAADVVENVQDHKTKGSA